MTVTMAVGPRNPFLADSEYPIGHGRCDQQDNTAVTGPVGPTEVLGADDIQYAWLGPGHFGGLVSGPYPDGRRVVWSNGRQTIAKLDYDTLEVLAVLATGDQDVTPVETMERELRELDELRGTDAVNHALTMAMNYLQGLDGVYSLVDCDNTLFLTRKDCVVAYRETDPSDPSSPIEIAARWDKPEEIAGEFVGVNLTFDGRLILSTDHGWLVCVSRDFAEVATLQLPGRGGAGGGPLAADARLRSTGRVRLGPQEPLGRRGQRDLPDLSRPPAPGRVDGRTALDRRGRRRVAGAVPQRRRVGFGLDVVTHGLRARRGPLRRHRRRRRRRQHHLVLARRDPGRLGAAAGRTIPPDRRDRARQHGRPGRRGHPDRAVDHRVRVRGDDGQQPAGLDPRRPPRGARCAASASTSATIRPTGPSGCTSTSGTRRRARSRRPGCAARSPRPTPCRSSPRGPGSSTPAAPETGSGRSRASTGPPGSRGFHYVLGGSKFNTLGAGVTVMDDGRLLFGTIFGKARVLRP